MNFDVTVCRCGILRKGGAPVIPHEIFYLLQSVYVACPIPLPQNGSVVPPSPLPPLQIILKSVLEVVGKMLCDLFFSAVNLL